MSAAQFLPFAVLALPAGVWADRHDRKRILITSDVGPARHPAHGRPAAAHRVAPTSSTWRCWRRVYGAADAFFAPAFTGLLPVDGQPAEPAAGERAARADALRRRHRRAGDRGPADRVRRRPGRRRCSSTPRRSRCRVVLLLPLRPRVVDAVRRRARTRRRPRTGSGRACARAGPRCAAGRGCSRSWPAWPSTTWSCCPRSSWSGRADRADEYARRALVGASSRPASGPAASSATCCCCGGDRASRCGSRR